jgi:hypothetical protein
MESETKTGKGQCTIEYAPDSKVGVAESCILCRVLDQYYLVQQSNNYGTRMWMKPDNPYWHARRHLPKTVCCELLLDSPPDTRTDRTNTAEGC